MGQRPGVQGILSLVGFFEGQWGGICVFKSKMGFNSAMASIVNTVIITHLIITLRLISSLRQCFDEV